MIEFDAAEAARGVGELYEPLAEEQGLSLDVEAPAPVPLHGNRELISQALANLVDNAIKYAAPAARPTAAVDSRSRRATRGRPCIAECRRSWPGIPGSRSRARGRAVCAAGEKPHDAGLGPGPEPRGRGGAAAWRRIAARGQCAGLARRAGAAASFRSRNLRLPPHPPAAPDAALRRRSRHYSAASHFRIMLMPIRRRWSMPGPQ